MHILCKYFFVRIVVDLFAGPFNCLSFSLELCVRACVRSCVCVCVCVCVVDLFAGPFNCLNFSLELCVCACVRVCLPLSLLFFPPNIVRFCYVYELFLLMTV